ncbi:DUF3023 domain-containing protein [Ehrlichia ruminantium]|uniref:DUF3023 domain-containing protein n=1 Tax=Ehrlichia ruminantium (strain Welgevonden) TaxID=254945 RepID=A0A0H3LZL6_EHRRW|nr:DUF3023 domain-containing protein [Ehrlichia ruminantium]QLK55235.1 DUF3023 domain-containing protein [Ehrlichia ruminantium]QLK56150.1 DUF3023 domain-containing protein [Ehrlichia ruminantium]UOD99359.1 DUF3023 domain-containing protein [Ehrlichia ruminantium]CAH58286.1 hypothetical protein Erum5570 [Ehrlichia ruminantium str. Welgevonden]CAI27078.1 Hypothetical protein ERWE_CDS_05840 [Ehrlichia ruminantium str. Welgevonden]
MLFKPGLPISKITESLHRSVIRELNRASEIHVNTCHCIGATINKKTLNICVDNKPGNRCTPVGTSLFRMECIIPAPVINNPRNISLQKLTQVLSSPFLITLEPLKVDAYFIVPEEELKNFIDLVKPLSSMPREGLLPIYNIGKFGTFSLCRPKSIGNRDVRHDVPFDEFKALNILGGLEDSIFFKTPSSIPDITKRNTKQSIADSKQQKVVVTGKEIQHKIQHIKKMFSRVSTTQCSPSSTPVSAQMTHNIEEKTASSPQKPAIQKVIVTSKQPRKEEIQFIYTKFPEAPEEHSSSNQTQETTSKHLEQHLSKSIVGGAPLIQKGTVDPQQVVRPKTFASSPFYKESTLPTTKYPSSNQTQETASKHLEQHPSKITQKGTINLQQVVRPKTQFSSSPFYKEQVLPNIKHPSSNQRQETANKHLEQRTLKKSTLGSMPPSIQKGTIDPQQVVRPKTQSASSPFYKESTLPTTKHQMLSVIEESTNSSVPINTLSSEEIPRFFSVDYFSSYKVLYDTYKESYKVDTLPTAPLVPSCQLEDDVFVENSNPHVSLN